MSINESGFDVFFSITDLMDNKKGSYHEKHSEKNCWQTSFINVLRGPRKVTCRWICWIWPPSITFIVQYKITLLRYKEVSSMCYWSHMELEVLVFYFWYIWSAVDLLHRILLLIPCIFLQSKHQQMHLVKIQSNSWQALNSHVFWHLGTILMESASTKKHKSNTVN